MSRLGMRIYVLLTTATLMLMAGLLTAQSARYGKITGTVVDAENVPLPGVQVEISSPALISAKRLTTTSESGKYVFLNLPTGTYQAAASMEGFKTSLLGNIQISADAVATVDFTMQLGAVNESITVSSEVPLIDTKTSNVQVDLDQNMLTKVPTSRDPFYDLSLTAPGMFDSGKDASWLPSPTSYSSATNENVFLVNGVNATDPRGGSWGSLVNVNFDAVQEVRVIALGSKAEYGSATGVAVDVLTKSGSNEYHGAVSFYNQLGSPANNVPQFGQSLGQDWLYLNPAADPTQTLLGKTQLDRELSLTFGGPIMKNKVWFFTAADLAGDDSKKPLWTVVGQNRDKYFDFKVSAEPAKNHQAWLAYHFERNSTAGDTWGDNVPWDPTLQFGTNTKNDSISSQWQWLPSSKSIVTFKYLGFWTGWDPHLPDNAPANSGYINWWKWQQFGVNGNFPYIEAHDASRHTVQADMSQYVENFLGQQDIKFGVQYTAGHGNDMNGYFPGYSNTAYPYGYDQNISYLQQYYGADGMKWWVDETHIAPFETVKTFKQTGAFFDDQWTVNPRLTFNLGLRFDNMTNQYGAGKVFAQPTDIHQNVGDLKVVRDRKGTGNVFDFNNWSPRVGATYSLTGDGKTVARASFGRYYAPVGLENLRRFGPDMPLASIHRLQYSVPWDQVDLNHNGIVDPDEVTATARLLRGLPATDMGWREVDQSWEARVAPGTKNQFMDQWTVNFEREIVPNLSFSATFIHKRTGNILVNTPIDRTTGRPFEYERKPYTTNNGQQVDLYSIILKDYNGDGAINGDDVQWIADNTDYEVNNLTALDGHNPERIYKGLQFEVNKRFSSRAQMLMSFLYSMSSGPANRNNFQDWNIEGPEIMDTTWFSSMNNSINNMEGPLPFTPKYEFKVSGSYQIPRIETDFGMRLRYNSGRPYWFLEDFPVIASWNFDNPPPGAVIDPSGTPILVGVNPNKPKYLPSSTIVDISFGRAFDLGRKQTVDVSLDCFNIFNVGAVSNADYYASPGQVTAVTSPSRKFRLGLSYQF